VGAEKIFDVINELNKKLGITIILVEHRLDLASKYANNVVVMDEGKVVLNGAPREIFISEEARLIGVGIPKATRLYQRLKQNGIQLKTVPVTTEETADLLRGALKRD
jgi:energy-coupling factor transporter ATP-binding protein EcfA2